MMRRLINILLITLAAGLNAMADTTVALSRASGAPGEEVRISIGMTGSEAVTALELRVDLKGAAVYADGSAAVGARTAGFAIQAGMAGTELRLYLYSPELTPIGEGEGDVATFSLRLAETAGTFTLEPRVVLGSAGGERVECTAEAAAIDVRAPQLEVRTKAVDFGHVAIRSAYHRTVEIANTGNEPMHVSGLRPSAPEVVSVSPAEATVAPGESAEFNVEFAPRERGAHQSRLEVMTDAVNGRPFTRWPVVTVNADPFSVNELHIIGAEGIADSEVSVGLTMNNMEPIVAMQAEIELPEGIDYVEGSAALGGRAADHTVTATAKGRLLTIVAFSPTNTPMAGEDGGLLTFGLKLGATGGWYRLEPRRVILSNAANEDMTSATSGAYVVVKSPKISGPESLDFGEQPLTQPLKGRYEVGNTGEVDLVIDRVTFLAEGFSVVTPLPLTVAPQGTAALEIAYSTSAAGNFATAMNIYSNDPAARMKPVALSGRSYSPNSLRAEGRYDAAERAYLLDIMLDNHAGITGVQFDVSVDSPAAVADNVEVSVTGRAAAYSAAASKVADGRFRVVMFNLGNAPIAGNDGAILRMAFAAADEAAGRVRFALSGVVLSTPAAENITSPGAEAEITIEATQPGDANGDRRITVSDGTTVMNRIIGFDSKNFSQAGADANTDGKITSSDITAIINKIINSK